MHYIFCYENQFDKILVYKVRNFNNNEKKKSSPKIFKKMFILRFIFVLYIINQVHSRPTGLSVLNELMHQSHSKEATAHITATKASPLSTTKDTLVHNGQSISIYEKYPWLDNALSLLFDKLLRILVVLVKKFVFKIDVTVADLF